MDTIITDNEQIQNDIFELFKISSRLSETTEKILEENNSFNDSWKEGLNKSISQYKKGETFEYTGFIKN